MPYSIIAFITILMGVLSYLLFNYFQEEPIPEGSSSTPLTFILFDFDGTLIDAYQEAINVCNELAQEFGFTQISDAERETIRHSSMKEIISNRKIPWYKVPQLVYHAKKRMAQKIDIMGPIDGIIPVIRTLKEQGYRLGIITTNRVSSVERFLKNNDLELFDVIYGDAKLFGKHKSIKRFLKKHTLPREAVVYVGDEVRDIEAARTVGIKIISASWGFNSHEKLLASQPTNIIKTPEELVLVINQTDTIDVNTLQTNLNKS